MNTFLIIENNKIIDSILSESEDYVKNKYPNKEFLKNEKKISIGWEKIDNVWRSPYIKDGLDYSWDEETSSWKTKTKTITDSLAHLI